MKKFTLTYFEIVLQLAHDVLKLFLKLNIALIEKTKSFQSTANLQGALGDLSLELLHAGSVATAGVYYSFVEVRIDLHININGLRFTTLDFACGARVIFTRLFVSQE